MGRNKRKDKIHSGRRKEGNRCPKIRKKISNKINEKLKEINDQAEELNEKVREELARLKLNLAAKSRNELNRIQEATRARYRDKDKKIYKILVQINKKKVGAQIILVLRKQDGTLTDKTKYMMEIALNQIGRASCRERV